MVDATLTFVYGWCNIDICLWLMQHWHLSMVDATLTFVYGWCNIDICWLLWQLTTKEIKQVQEDKMRLTEHFIVTLPQLLAKVCVNSTYSAASLQRCQPLRFECNDYNILLPLRLLRCMSRSLRQQHIPNSHKNSCCKRLNLRIKHAL